MAALGFVLQYALLNFTLDSELSPILATFGLVGDHPERAARAVLRRPAAARRRRDRDGEHHVSDEISIGWFPLLTFAVAVVLLDRAPAPDPLHAARALAARDVRRPAHRTAHRDRQPQALRDRDGDVARAPRRSRASSSASARASIRPAGRLRLIFAFEAVIIGGLGSLWGTLRRRDRARGRADAGSRDLGRLGRAHGASRLPRDPARASARVSSPSRTDVTTGRTATSATGRGRAAHVDGRGRRRSCSPVASGCSSPSRGGRARADMRDLVELFTLLALAQMWNLLAGYAGLVSIGQQAFIGIGAYSLLRARRQGPTSTPSPPWRSPASSPRPPSPSRRCSRLPPAWWLLRDRDLGDRRGVLPADDQRLRSRRRRRRRQGRDDPVRGPARAHASARTGRTGGRWASAPGRCCSTTRSSARGSASR